MTGTDHFIHLSCANCGGKLDVYDDMERFVCGYCGSQMAVQRRGGTIALKAVTEAIKQVQIGTDKTAAELAIVRLERENAILADQLRHMPVPSGLGRILLRLLILGVLLTTGMVLTALLGTFLGALNKTLGSVAALASLLATVGLAVWVSFFKVKGGAPVDPRRAALEHQLIDTHNALELNRSVVRGSTPNRPCRVCQTEVGLSAKHCTRCGTDIRL